jgi:hypothetical protein
MSGWIGDDPILEAFNGLFAEHIPCTNPDSTFDQKPEG